MIILYTMVATGVFIGLKDHYTDSAIGLLIIPLFWPVLLGELLVIHYNKQA